ncbi:MAG: polymer-forming cytoskeletal protein, partial [Oscillospiraceae bacterium]
EVKKETSVEYDNEKDESFEGRKILSNGIPTPYGNAAIKLPLTPPTAPAVVEAATPSPAPAPAAPVAPAAVAESPAASTHSAPSSLGVSPAPARPMFIRKDPPNGGTYDKTVIANGTVITGDIISGGDLELSGEVTGNVRVDGELRLWGRIEGNVESGDLDVMGGKIKGNIITSGIVSLDTDSIVAGNVTASALSLDGKLKGDVDIEGAVTIGSTGVQIGKITARQLSIGQGAKLNSTIQMTNEDASAMAEEIFA